VRHINIVQYDFGIVFKIQLLDNNKEKINLVNSNVKVLNKYPNGIFNPITNIAILDSSKGNIEVTLKVADTTLLGDYFIYVGIDSASFNINAITPITYTVKTR